MCNLYDFIDFRIVTTRHKLDEIKEMKRVQSQMMLLISSLIVVFPETQKTRNILTLNT